MENMSIPMPVGSNFPDYKYFATQNPSPRFIVGIDWGLRFPVYAFGSNLMFHPMLPPHYIENTIQHLRQERKRYLKRNDKKYAKVYERAMEDYLVRYVTAYAAYLVSVCQPHGVIAVEDQECFDFLDYPIYKNGFTEELYTRRIYIALTTMAKITKDIDVIRVSRTNSSITCPVCGHISKKNRDKEHHIFKCKKCKTSGNDDAIAAWNIHNRGYQIVNGEEFPYSKYVTGQSSSLDSNAYYLHQYMEYLEKKEPVIPLEKVN